MKENKTKKAVLKEELPSWDLSVAYYNGLDDPQIEADVEQVKRNIKAMSRFEGKLATLAPHEFEMFVALYEGVMTYINKLYHFAHLFADTQKDIAADDGVVCSFRSPHSVECLCIQFVCRRLQRYASHRHRTGI